MNAKTTKTIVAASIGFITIVLSCIATPALRYRHAYSFKDKATIEGLLSTSSVYVVEHLPRDETSSHWSYTDNSGLFREALSKIRFVEEQNKFPYKYKEKGCYSALRFFPDCYQFRMNGTFDECSVEYRGNMSFSAVRYYTLDPADGQKLVDLVKERGHRV